jgi:hypothetical protein
MPDLPKLDVFNAYEDGKHRRYSLLFSVNGGAFAIAKVLSEKPNEPSVMGHLHVQQLAVGMLAFTILMLFDIYTFADKMKRLQGNSKPEIFMLQGKVALVLIGALICLGWLLGGVI